MDNFEQELGRVTQVGEILHGIRSAVAKKNEKEKERASAARARIEEQFDLLQQPLVELVRSGEMEGIALGGGFVLDGYEFRELPNILNAQCDRCTHTCLMVENNGEVSLVQPRRFAGMFLPREYYDVSDGTVTIMQGICGLFLGIAIGLAIGGYEGILSSPQGDPIIRGAMVLGILAGFSVRPVRAVFGLVARHYMGLVYKKVQLSLALEEAGERALGLSSRRIEEALQKAVFLVEIKLQALGVAPLPKIKASQSHMLGSGAARQFPEAAGMRPAAQSIRCWE